MRPSGTMARFSDLAVTLSFFRLFYLLYFPTSLGYFPVVSARIGGKRVPDLTFQPKKNLENLIWTDRAKESDPRSSCATVLDDYFRENYDPNKKSSSVLGQLYAEVPIPCNYGGGRATDRQPCRVNLTRINPECSPENRYGYPEGKPCVLIMLDKLNYWEPEPYVTPNDWSLARDREMPEWLIQKAHALIEENEDYKDTIWISCQGVDPVDRENIGPLKYYPVGYTNKDFPGIPKYYYPYTDNQDQFRDPFVFVKFSNVNRHVAIRVECVPWAKNLYPSTSEVKFTLKVD